MDQLQCVQSIFRLTHDLASQRSPVRLTDNSHSYEPLVIYNDHLYHNSSPLPFFLSPIDHQDLFSIPGAGCPEPFTGILIVTFVPPAASRSALRP